MQFHATAYPGPPSTAILAEPIAAGERPALFRVWISESLSSRRVATAFFRAYCNSRGVPLGENPRVVERFTVSADGQRLAYTVTVTDPEVFTEPARASRKWVAKDGVELLPYNCQPPPATQP